MKNLLIPATILCVSGFLGCLIATQSTEGAAHAIMWVAALGYFIGSSFCFYCLSKKTA